MHPLSKQSIVSISLGELCAAREAVAHAAD